MAADYPTSVKSFSTKVDNVDLVMAADINDIQTEVAAIESQLITSKLAAITEIGAWANWTPTETGWTGLPTGTYRYVQIGKLIVCNIDMTAGTSNDTTASISLPVTAANVYTSGNIAYATDNGSELRTLCRWEISPNGTAVDLFSNTVAGTWTASGNKVIRCVVTYEAA